MIDGYSLVLASDVLERDGMALELYDESGVKLAEVFRDDTNGERTLNVLAADGVPVHVAEWLLRRSAETL